MTAAENCHYHFVPGQAGFGKQQSFAFRFQTPDKVVVFSGDTGMCMEKLVPIYKGADVLVHEVINLPAAEKLVAALAPPSSQYYAGVMRHMRTEHSTPEEVGQVAAKAGVGMVVLTHLTPGGDMLPDSAYSDGVKKYYSGPVVVGRDLLEIP